MTTAIIHIDQHNVLICHTNQSFPTIIQVEIPVYHVALDI